MRRTILSVLLAAVLLTGCAANRTGRTPDQVDAPSAEQPAPPVIGQTPGGSGSGQAVTGPVPGIWGAEQIFTEEFMGNSASLGARTLRPGDNPAPADPFIISVNLHPVPDLSWFDAVKVEGSGYKAIKENFTSGQLHLTLEPGKAGDVVTVTLPPVTGADQTVYRFTRTATPTARLEAESKGAWEEVKPHLVYPMSNLKLRLTFTTAMDRAVVEQKLREQATAHHPLMDGANYRWQDDRTLLITFAEAPPTVNWSLTGSYDLNGLYLAGPIPAVHTGEAPYLAAIDPETGKETYLREVMPEVVASAQAMGGRKLRLTAYDLMGGHYFHTLPHFWLLDLQDGTTKSIAWDWTARLVETTGEVKPYKFENDGTYDQGPISPDGTQWLFYRLPSAPTESGQIFEVGLEIRTADGTLITALETKVRVMAGKYGYGRPQAVWAPDGKSVIFTSDIERQQTELIHVDLTTGVSRKVATVPAFFNMFAPGEQLQWRAGRVAAGRTIVDVASGQVIRQVEGPVATRFLSPDGNHLLLARESSNNGDWGPVSLVSLDTGALVDLGMGLPVGWTADGKPLVIRWANYEYRYIMVGL